jgi:hypothetical protein
MREPWKMTYFTPVAERSSRSPRGGRSDSRDDAVGASDPPLGDRSHGAMRKAAQRTSGLKGA